MQPPDHIIRAPGKLVLVGEYAVLDGAPAVVVAIDRGVACAVWDDGAPLRITTPGGDDRFVRPALTGTTGRYVFSDWNPVQLPAKPGFGGSAAACVAACVAAGRPPADAFGIHHTVQGGGSGVDVAAAAHGGMLRFEAGATTPMPRPVCPVVVYSGQSARTGPRVAAYRAWPDRQAFVRQSRAIVDTFADQPIVGLAAAGDLLAHMAAQAGLAYQTPGLDKIRHLARIHGGAAKASGAGGGDCAVALFPNPESERAFGEACRDVGLSVIAVAVAPGAHRDNGGHD